MNFGETKIFIEHLILGYKSFKINLLKWVKVFLFVLMANSLNSMECFKEGEWVILHQLNNKRLARVGRKGFASLGKDFVNLEGVIGCLPWAYFKMTPEVGSKTRKRVFNLVPVEEDDETVDCDEEISGTVEEDKDNRTINDDGQSQSLSSFEIEALREGGLSGKEIVNHLVAGSATYDKKTRYAQSKYLRKKESKHCLRERVRVRKTSLSCVAEVLCSGGGGEGSRGSIVGMRPDTLSQMLTALNIQWKKTRPFQSLDPITSSANIKSCNENTIANEEIAVVSNDESNRGNSCIHSSESSIDDQKKCSGAFGGENTSLNEVMTPKVLHGKKSHLSQWTTYIVYESGNWGLLVASLLTYLPSYGPRLIHLYPGHGIPCLIAPRALNLPHEKMSILSSVNLRALLDKLGKLDYIKSLSENVAHPDPIVNMEDSKSNFLNDKVKKANISDIQEYNKEQEKSDQSTEEFPHSKSLQEKSDDGIHLHIAEGIGKGKKRKLETTGECPEGEIVEKKRRWEVEAETAAAALISCKADGLIVVASREHPVSIVLSLLPYLAPSRPLVVYCPYREPLLDLYAVLKGWEPWVGRYGGRGSKDALPRVANLRVTESWLRNYQIMPNRTHPEINMSPGGGFIMTGLVVDFNGD